MSTTENANEPSFEIPNPSPVPFETQMHRLLSSFLLESVEKETKILAAKAQIAERTGWSWQAINELPFEDLVKLSIYFDTNEIVKNHKVWERNDTLLREINKIAALITNGINKPVYSHEREDRWVKEQRIQNYLDTADEIVEGGFELVRQSENFTPHQLDDVELIYRIVRAALDVLMQKNS